jgi:hypothetical protein
MHTVIRMHHATALCCLLVARHNDTSNAVVCMIFTVHRQPLHVITLLVRLLYKFAASQHCWHAAAADIIY